MRRIGVLGGTFDPIHAGHLGLASAALEAAGLEKVDLVPSFSPPHRPSHRPAAHWHRFAMVVLATTDRPRLLASDREIRRAGISYMLETLRSYREDDTPAVPLLILGLDAFAELPSWREPEALVAEFDLLVASRPGVRKEEVLQGLPAWLRRRISPLPELSQPPAGAGRPCGGRIALFDMPPYMVSATEVRERLARKETIKSLVPEAVASYIGKYDIYGGGYPATGE